VIEVVGIDYGAAGDKEIVGSVGAFTASSDRLIVCSTCGENTAVCVVTALNTFCWLSEDGGWDYAQKDGKIE
jgi:hypothetical protein